MKNKTMPSVQQQHLTSTNNSNIQQQQRHHDHNHHNQHHQQYQQQIQSNHHQPHHTQQLRQIDASQHHHPEQQQQQQMQQLLPSVPMMPHQQLSAMGASSSHQNGIVGSAAQPQTSAGGTSSSNQTVSSSSSSSSSSSNFVKKEMPANGKKTKGRVRIKMEFIHNKLRRYTTFSKRKTGIMKKAFELATLTGTQVMLLVASETGHVYTFATRKLQPMIISDAGKALIQTCLNSPDSDNLLMSSASGSSNSQQQQQQQQQQQNGTNVNNNSSSSSSSPTSGGAGSLQNQTRSDGSPTSGGVAMANNHLQLSPPSNNLQMMGHQQAQHNSSNSSSAVQSPLSGLQPLSSPSQQQQQQSIISNNNNNHQTNNKQHSASALHQMGPTVGTLTTPLNNPIGIQSQHNVMLATGANSSSSSSQQSTNGNQHQSAASSANTTDQRMSATGFEEPELSYSISDLDDRPSFNQCLPVTAASISGTLTGVNSVGAILQPSSGASAHDTIPDKTNTNLIPGSGPDQQLVGVPHFNYNPIYNGLSQQQASNVQHYANRLGANCSGRQTSYLNSGDMFLNEDDEAENDHETGHDNEDLLNEIYHFAEEADKRTSSKQFDIDCAQRGNNHAELINERSMANVNGVRHQLQNQLSDNFNHDQAQSDATTIVSMNSSQYVPTNQVGKARAIQSQQQSMMAPNGRVQRRIMSTNQNQNQNQHLMVSFQQPMASTNMNELHEDCGGLFVEYQTNRNPAEGSSGLEELHSLNVTNCDSETLEEQINLLSHDADLGFEASSELYQQDEYQDFAMNNSNDHFLNMLFMNTNNTLQSVEAAAHCNNLELNEAHSSQGLIQNPSSIPVMTIPSDTGPEKLTSSEPLYQSSGTAKRLAQHNKGPGNRVSTKGIRSLIRPDTTGGRDKGKVANDTFSNNVQQTINKTNTNKQLMPKRSGGTATGTTKSTRQKAHTDKWPLSSSSSNPDTQQAANASVKTSKALNVYEGEDPYKQQLENLRKKLRMDLGPAVTLTSVVGKSAPSTTTTKASSAKTGAARSDQTNVHGVNDSSVLNKQSQAGYIDALMLH